MDGPAAGLLATRETAAARGGADSVAGAPSRATARSTSGRVRAWLARPLVAALVLLACYAAASTFDNPRGFLGTDTGAKVATLQVMQDRHSFVPDAGYWAAADDPSASLHPLYDTLRVGDHYVAVTTLPMILLARPLWALGGDRLALLLPMLGAVACAAAARALARRLGARSPATVFWVVGLASPVFVYALDLWEHTLGLACMAWAVVLLLDTAFPARTRGRAPLAFLPALGAGALFGLAATMRTEALFYGALATALTIVTLVIGDRAVRRAVAVGIGALAGIVPVLVANTLLERAVLGGSLRSARATGTAGAAGSNLATRLGEGLRTTIGLNYASLWVEALAGGCLVVALVAAAVLLRRGAARPRYAAELIGAAALLLLVRLHSGLSFVSGLVPAYPLAAFGAVLAWRDRRRRLLAAIALLALPGVWMFQYTGGAGPQWGGRYVLCSGFILGVLGAVAIENFPRWSRVATIALCAAVTLAGVRYLEIRSAQGARAADTIAARPEAVVISRFAHLFRETGAAYTPARQWLTAVDDHDLARAVAIAHDHHARTVAVVAEVGVPARLAGYRLQHRAPLPLFSEHLEIDTYAAAP